MNREPLHCVAQAAFPPYNSVNHSLYCGLLARRVIIRHMERKSRLVDTTCIVYAKKDDDDDDDDEKAKRPQPAVGLLTTLNALDTTPCCTE